MKTTSELDFELASTSNQIILRLDKILNKL